MRISIGLTFAYAIGGQRRGEGTRADRHARGGQELEPVGEGTAGQENGTWARQNGAECNLPCPYGPKRRKVR